jgi:hypothetical protein
VNTTSPLRDRVRAQLVGGAEKVTEGLRKGLADASIRPHVDIGEAVTDITATAFGIAFEWIVVSGEHDLGSELTSVRARIIRDSGRQGR